LKFCTILSYSCYKELGRVRQGAMALFMELRRNADIYQCT